MRKLSRAFLCSFLAAIFILGCFAFPLRANSMETIKLDEHLHAEYVCNGFTAYRLSISRSTVYLFQPTATSVEYDLKNIDSKVLDQLGDNPFCCIYKDDGTEIPTTYKIWWKSGVAGTDSQYYLEKGEYILIVRSDKVCNLKIDGFDGEIYMTKDGTRMDFTPFPNQGGFIQNYIDDIENHDYKLVVKPGNSGNKYKIYTTNYKNSYRDLDETVEIQINYGEDLFIPIEFNEEKESFNFFFKFQTIGSKEYPFDKCRNILVEKWSIQIIDFSFDDSSSINIQNNLTPKEYFGKGLSYVDMVISEPIAFFTKLPGAQFAAEYFFIKDNDLGANYQITQGKNYEIKPHWYNDQEVYSFTPEKDDTYKLTSSGWDANPYVAVFDSDDNCIGWDDGNYSITDLNFNDYYQHLIKGEVSHNLDMDLDLKAGQTYYFYFTNSLANYYCD
ncbi:MAG: hypothetical protein J6U23_07620, partial [Clostridiales bacterium]|nr:hypothetical protein [Clostridiales bacterium]